MSAGVRRATATKKSESGSDLTSKRATRTLITSVVETPTVTVSEPESAPTKRRSGLVKVVSETFLGLKNKAVDQVSKAFRSNQKRIEASSHAESSFKGISTRSAAKTSHPTREASSEKESSPISTSVVSAALPLAETSHSPQTVAVVAPEVAAEPTPAVKPFLTEGLYSNVVSHPKANPKSKYSKTSRAIRASKATAIEKGKVDGDATEANKLLPLPLHWGLRKMEDREEFLVPWDIMSEWQAGELDSQKSPTKYTKLRKSK
jgi:hypothetical protein